MKTKELKAAMKELGYDADEIEERLYVVKLLKGYVPVSVRELQKMSQKDLSKLLSVTWYDDEYRCDNEGVGIQFLKITEISKGKYLVEYNDTCGDPSMTIDIDMEINNIQGDCANYGLYKKIK